jgi:hypothetical protein
MSRSGILLDNSGQKIDMPGRGGELSRRVECGDEGDLGNCAS